MDRRQVLVTISLGGACLLAGCASPQWTRPDSSFAQAEQDELTCRDQAEREVSRRGVGIYGSLMDMYGPNFQMPARGMRQVIGDPGPMFDIDPVRRNLEKDRIADACMRAKGYTLGSLKD